MDSIVNPVDLTLVMQQRVDGQRLDADAKKSSILGEVLHLK